VVANSSPRQTHERRVLMMNITRARLSLCTQGFSEPSPRGPGRPVTECLGDFTAESPGSPAGRLDGPKVSPGLFAGAP
jgi:hypothetical protein